MIFGDISGAANRRPHIFMTKAMTMPMQELTLDYMLSDPIVQVLMRRDGLVEADVRGLAAYVQSRRDGGVDEFAEAKSFVPNPEA